MTLDLLAALAVAENLARQAGALMRDAAQRPRQITFKAANDLVTETDKACEALIVAGLREAFPDHAIIGEEGTQIGTDEAGRYCWHVDPLDGTTNFAHGVPHFCTSIGLADPNGFPILGAIYDPLLGELFKAAQGHGAYLNDQPIHVSQIEKLHHALLATGFSKDRWTNPDNNTREYVNFVLRAQSVSRLGSAALELSYVASGRFEAFWQPRAHSWDVVAGIACVLEAGGRVTNFQGGTENAYNGEAIFASNGRIHDQMLDVFARGEAAPRP